MGKSNSNIHRYPLNGRYATLGDLVQIFGKYSEDYKKISHTDEGWGEYQPFKAIVFGNNYNSNGDLIAQNPYELAWFDNVYSETEKQQDGKTMKIIQDKDSNIYGFDRPIRAKDVKNSSQDSGSYVFRFIIPTEAKDPKGLSRYYYNYKNSYGESTVMYAVQNIIKLFKKKYGNVSNVKNFFFGQTDFNDGIKDSTAVPLRILSDDMPIYVYLGSSNNNFLNNPTSNKTCYDIANFTYSYVKSISLTQNEISRDISNHIIPWNTTHNPINVLSQTRSINKITLIDDNGTIFKTGSDELITIDYEATQKWDWKEGSTDISDSSIFSGTVYLKLQINNKFEYYNGNNESLQDIITKANSSKSNEVIPSIFCLNNQAKDTLYDMISGSSAYSNLGSIAWSYQYIQYPNYTDDFKVWLDSLQNTYTKWNEGETLKRAPNKAGNNVAATNTKLELLINYFFSDQKTSDNSYAYRNNNANKIDDNNYYKILYFTKIFLNSQRFFTSYVHAFSYVKVSNKTYASNEPILLCDINMFEIIESFEIVSAVHNPATALPAYPITKDTKIQIDVKYKIKFKDINSPSVPESWTFTISFADIINASANTEKDYIYYSLKQVGGGEIKYGNLGFPSLRGTLDGIIDASLGTYAWPSTDQLELTMDNLTQEYIDNRTEYEDTNNSNTYSGMEDLKNQGPCGMLRIKGVYDKSSEDNKKASAFDIDVSLYRHKNFYGTINSLAATGGQEVNIYYNEEVVYKDNDIPNTSITYIASTKLYNFSEVNNEFNNISGNIYTVQPMNNQHFYMTLKTETGKFRYYKSRVKVVEEGTTEKTGYTNDLDVSFWVDNAGGWNSYTNVVSKNTTNSKTELQYEININNMYSKYHYIKFKFKDSDINYYIKLSSNSGSNNIKICPLVGINNAAYEQSSILGYDNPINTIKRNQFRYGYLIYNTDKNYAFNSTVYDVQQCSSESYQKNSDGSTYNINNINTAYFKVTSLKFEDNVNGKTYYSSNKNPTLNAVITTSNNSYQIYKDYYLFSSAIPLQNLGGNNKYVYFSASPIYIVNVSSNITNNISNTGVDKDNNNVNQIISNSHLIVENFQYSNKLPTITNNFVIFASNENAWINSDNIKIKYNNNTKTLGEFANEYLSSLSYNINIKGLSKDITLSNSNLSNTKFPNVSSNLVSNRENIIYMEISGNVDTYDLTIKSMPDNITNSTVTGISKGTECSISASTSNNYQFDHWEFNNRDVIINSTTSSNTTIKYNGSDSSITITAYYKCLLVINKGEYDGTIIKYPVVTGDYYEYNKSVTLTCEDKNDSNYYFDSYTNNSNTIENNPYQLTIMDYTEITVNYKKYITVITSIQISGETTNVPDTIAIIDAQTKIKETKGFSISLTIKNTNEYKFKEFKVDNVKNQTITSNNNVHTITGNVQDPNINKISIIGVIEKI